MIMTFRNRLIYELNKQFNRGEHWQWCWQCNHPTSFAPKIRIIFPGPFHKRVAFVFMVKMLQMASSNSMTSFPPLVNKSLDFSYSLKQSKRSLGGLYQPITKCFPGMVVSFLLPNISPIHFKSFKWLYLAQRMVYFLMNVSKLSVLSFGKNLIHINLFISKDDCEQIRLCKILTLQLLIEGDGKQAKYSLSLYAWRKRSNDRKLGIQSFEPWYLKKFLRKRLSANLLSIVSSDSKSWGTLLLLLVLLLITYISVFQ